MDNHVQEEVPREISINFTDYDSRYTPERKSTKVENEAVIFWEISDTGEYCQSFPYKAVEICLENCTYR